MTELYVKPCPFCGADETIAVPGPISNDCAWKGIRVGCSYCGAYGGPSDTWKGAVDEWNSRAIADPGVLGNEKEG